MAYFKTGKKRSLTVTITKKSNGDIVSGYPKVYSGTTTFTWDGVIYPTLTGTTFEELSYEDYLTRLEDFKQYVQSLESGLDIDRDLDPNYPPTSIGDVAQCSPEPSQCTTTFIVSKLTSGASGYIENNGDEIYLISGIEGTLLNITGTTTNGTVIVGWSEDSYGNNLLSTGSTFNIPLSCGKTYYFVIRQNAVAIKRFCYYPPSTILDEICTSCNESVDVYFDYLDMIANGFENITWYSDFDLTIELPDGFYKLSEITASYRGSIIVTVLNFPPIYTIVNGLVTEKGFCDPDLLYCCI
jgi:hypothetical protein